MSLVKNIKIGSNTYQINATQLEGKSASEYALKTDLSKFDKLALKIVSTLPTATAATQDAIYLVAHGGHSDSPDSYDEYITVESSGKYSWEKIGNTDVKLDGYLKTTDVIDALNNQSATNPLSANQGYQLNQRLDEVETYGSKLVTVEDDIIGINGSISSLSTRLTTAENNISDRYTKGEVDGFLTEKAKTCNTKDIPYSEIAGNGTYIGSAKGGPYRTGDASSHENIIYVQNTNGGGNYRFELSHDFWENNGIHYRYKPEGDWSSWKTLIDSDNIGSQHVAEADHASVATLANSVSLPRDTSYNPDEYSNNGDEKVFAKETNLGSSIGGLGYHWWHIFNNLSLDGYYSTQLALMMCDAKGLKQTPYLAFRNHTREGWNDWAIAITDKTIADQTVKSFTATEIDHGDKFKGDLESTTKVSAPVIEVTNHLTNSDGNDINLPGKAGTLTTTDDLNNYVAKGSSTSSSTTGITASASAPTFTGTAHGHTINDNGHAHTYSKTTSASAAGWNISVDGSTLIFTSNTSVSLGYTNTATANSKTGISINTTVAGGSVGKPSITISDPGHSHKEN